MSLRILSNVSLSRLTTYHIGGRADFFVAPHTLEELKESLSWAKINKQPFYILGGGSNILISDKGFQGLIIKLDNKVLELEEDENSKVILRVGAGLKLAALLKYCLAHKPYLSGMEWAAGIPGSVGGAIFGNAGAFKENIGERVMTIYAYDLKNQTLEALTQEDCRFGYRDSVFKRREKIIWSGEMVLSKGDKTLGKNKILEHLKKRQEKQPLEYPSAGSIFKNPKIEEIHNLSPANQMEVSLFTEVVPAAWLIEKCGLKGYQIGQAQISPKHANFFVNLKRAKAQDVWDLIKLTQTEVFKKFGCQLISEVNFLGNFK